ncbi:hypothetical protein AVEN_56283-1 [Araneus ventricosus]|uniref:Uncharacterized protein n=1 Tax=Araneus ventricosus TaxID=182803 RepID=A0A4Y2RWL5_ARAVE|nr:hypothetical protein AVEN_56283-1 [Araneus ventricosus]
MRCFGDFSLCSYLCSAGLERPERLWRGFRLDFFPHRLAFGSTHFRVNLVSIFHSHVHLKTIFKPVIHDRSAFKSRGGTPHHFNFYLIYLGTSFMATLFHANPSAMGHSDNLLRLPAAKTRILERESLAPIQVSIPVAFQHLCPGSPNRAIGYPN